MDCEEDEPEPYDVAGWRRRIESATLGTVRPAALVCAVQDMDPAEKRTVGALLAEVSVRITRILRNFIGTNHPNQGWDLIEDTRNTLLQAVLKPTSADGRALRTAFAGTVRYRARDAIRADRKHRDLIDYALDEDELPRRDLTATPNLEQDAHVESVLRRIEDPRKRLALRLFMDGAQRNSTIGFSIASALDVSAKTVETWIRDLQAELRTIAGDRR